MKHALVDIQDKIIRCQDFDETPPILSASKKLCWLEYQEVYPPLAEGMVYIDADLNVDRNAGVIIKTYGLVAVVPLPIIVSPRQIRQALTAAGMRAAVEAGVAAANQDTQDWWEFATSIEENHAMIATMASALGITDSQRHDIFVLAASL